MRFAALRRMVPNCCKLWLREWILTGYGVPFSRFDVPSPLVQMFRGSGPIRLIDVGTSSGDFANSLDKFCGISRALLIEPIPTRCVELARRFETTRFSVVQSAAGSGEATMEMDILNWDYGSSLLPLERTDVNIIGGLDLSVRSKVWTRVAPLDVLCQEQSFTGSIDLLKIDVQGAEHMVLRGAPEILRRTRAIWIEVSFRPFYRGAMRFETIYDLCQGAGFKLMALSEGFRAVDGELLQGDALFVQRHAIPRLAKAPLELAVA